jgi:uncharacterized protein (TIGR02246 family)
MTTETTATTEIEELAERYGEAWNSQDLEAIMELHGDDCSFQAHAAGSPAAEGKGAVREAFAAYLAQMPDISFATRSLRCGDDYWVLESTMTAPSPSRSRSTISRSAPTAPGSRSTAST